MLHLEIWRNGLGNNDDSGFENCCDLIEADANTDFKKFETNLQSVLEKFESHNKDYDYIRSYLNILNYPKFCMF